MRKNYSLLMEQQGEAPPGQQQQSSLPEGQQQQQESQPWIDPKTGTFGKDWLASLPPDVIPEDLRPTAGQYASLGALVKGLRETKAALTGKIPEGMVQLPGKDSKPEVLAAFRKAYGIPESPEGYAIKKPENPEVAKFYNEDIAKQFLAESHRLGLNSQQAQDLINWQTTMFSTQAKAMEEHNKTQEQQDIAAREAELKGLFGQQYDARMVDAHRVAAAIGIDPEILQFIPAKDLAAISAFAGKISEDHLPAASAINNGGLTSQALAKDIMTNPGNPKYEAYRDKSHPKHKEVFAEVNRGMGIPG